MTNLSEVYEGGVRTVVSPRQRLVGMSLFAVGAMLVVGAIPIATTDVASWFGVELGVFQARELAGVLAGLGVPAVFVGIFVVLPASEPTRAAAAIGASLAVFGVALFSHAYPHQWLANDPQLALATTALYSLGTIVTSWCLFVAAATFKTRNDPGGTARVEITEEGDVRIVSAPSSGGGSSGRSSMRESIPGFGSVGLFGSDPDGSVPTQTNDGGQYTAGDDDTGGYTTGGNAGHNASTNANTDQYPTTGAGNHTTETEDGMLVPEPTSDGGTAATDDPALEDDVLRSAKQRSQPDEYCGNCAHFEYVRVDGELVPYCGRHADLLDDMEACREWEANSQTTFPRR